jgi:hypothetical protein
MFEFAIITGKNALANKFIIEVGQVQRELALHIVQIFLGLMEFVKGHVSIGTCAVK